MALCEKIFHGIVITILIISNVWAQKPGPIIESGKESAVIKNPSCGTFTIWVNGRDLEVGSQEELKLGTPNWDTFRWMPGKIGSMGERKMRHPLSSKPPLSFGPNAGGTHSGKQKYGYDFNVPEGTPVLAMEAGRVVMVVQHFTEAHRDLKRLMEVNAILVLHEDGSVAAYAHLKPLSAVVKLCDEVKAGERIALSGHTGYSSTPHLHVDVFRPVTRGEHQTIPLIFLP